MVGGGRAQRSASQLVRLAWPRRWSHGPQVRKSSGVAAPPFDVAGGLRVAQPQSQPPQVPEYGVAPEPGARPRTGEQFGGLLHEASGRVRSGLEGQAPQDVLQVEVHGRDAGELEVDRNGVRSRPHAVVRPRVGVGEGEGDQGGLPRAGRRRQHRRAVLVQGRAQGGDGVADGEAFGGAEVHRPSVPRRPYHRAINCNEKGFECCGDSCTAPFSQSPAALLRCSHESSHQSCANGQVSNAPGPRSGAGV